MADELRFDEAKGEYVPNVPNDTTEHVIPTEPVPTTMFPPVEKVDLAEQADRVVTRVGVGIVADKLTETIARDHLSEDKSTFENGAQSSRLDTMWELLPFHALEDMANRLTLGAKKYSADNWKKGGKEFVKARYRHLIRHTHHLQLCNAQAEVDDDLAAIHCNAAFLSWFRRNKPKAYTQAFAELNVPYPDTE